MLVKESEYPDALAGVPAVYADDTCPPDALGEVTGWQPTHFKAVVDQGEIRISAPMASLLDIIAYGIAIHTAHEGEAEHRQFGVTISHLPAAPMDEESFSRDLSDAPSVALATQEGIGLYLPQLGEPRFVRDGSPTRIPAGTFCRIPSGACLSAPEIQDLDVKAIAGGGSMSWSRVDDRC